MATRFAAILIVSASMVPGCGPDESEQRADRIKLKIPAALKRAYHESKHFQFDTAYAALQGIEDEIKASGLDMPEERERIREAFRVIATAKAEHYRLTQLGHVVFEGKLIPAEERDRILAEREAAKQRRRDELKRIAEERERERLLEEKAAKEDHEISDEEKRFLGYVTFEGKLYPPEEGWRLRIEADHRMVRGWVQAYIEESRRKTAGKLVLPTGNRVAYGAWFWNPPTHPGVWSPKFGRLGYLSVPIVQILSPEMMIVDIGGLSAFVLGVPTTGYVDGQFTEDLPLMIVGGTQQYQTAGGVMRTAFTMMPFPFDHYNIPFPAGTLSPEDEARAQAGAQNPP